jgi:hypothetical protein
MRTYWEVKAQLQAFLTSTIYMEMGGQIPATVGLSPVKELLLLIG